MVAESGDGVPYATALRLVTNEEQIWDETSIAGKKAGEEGASLPPLCAMFSHSSSKLQESGGYSALCPWPTLLNRAGIPRDENTCFHKIKELFFVLRQCKDNDFVINNPI